jgi:hypothetical protein
MSYIRPKVKNTEDAEDILQEVWYQFSSLTNLSEIVNVGGWLYRVTANKITDKYRKKKTENLEDFVYEDEDGDFSIKDILLMDESAGPKLKCFRMRSGKSCLKLWMNCRKNKDWSMWKMNSMTKPFRKLRMNRAKILKRLSAVKIMP